MKRKKNYIEALIEQGEHKQQDFKFAVNDARKIARSLVAFANTSGGRLLIGVKDNGVVAGIKSDEEYYMIQSAATQFCRPEIEFQYKTWKIAGKAVLEIIVHESDQKPCLALGNDDHWMAWIRYEDQNILANSVLVNAWKRKYSTEGVFFKYDGAEKELLAFIEQKGICDLKSIQKATSFPYKRLIQKLADLIAMDVLNITITDKEITYHLDPGKDY